MRRQSPLHYNKRVRRGAAMVIALAIILALTLLVMGTQLLVIQQAKVSRSERNYERALQMAEAGANAYLYEMSNNYQIKSNKFVTSSYPSYMPPYNPIATADVTNWKNLDYFRQHYNTGDARFPLTKYPLPLGPNDKTPGFCVGHTGSGGNIIVISYGFCNGAVRRIMVAADGYSTFDWAAVYGLNPADALDLKNDTITGSMGAEGTMNTNGSTSLVNGPVLLAAAGSTANPSPPTVTSPATTPSVVRSSASLGIPTADAAANSWALSEFGVTTTAGVQYFRSNNNNNAVGLRLLVINTEKNKTHSGLVRELNDPSPSKKYTVLPTNSYTLSTLSSNYTASLAKGGMDSSTEAFYGIRVYPGNYYFDDIQTGDGTGSNKNGNYGTLDIRSYADGAGPVTPLIYQYDWSPIPTVNPTSSMSAENNVRFWIGDTTSHTPSELDLITMENSMYTSRFRVYDANKGGVSLKMTNGTLDLSLLAYNYDTASGSYYGTIDVKTNTNVFGSLIGWNVTTDGNNNVSKPSLVDGTGNDGVFLYNVTKWTEQKL